MEFTSNLKVNSNTFKEKAMKEINITNILDGVSTIVKKMYTALYNEHKEYCEQFSWKYKMYCEQNSITISENIDDVVSTLTLMDINSLKETLTTSEENFNNNRFNDISYVFYSKEQYKVLFITVKNGIVTKFYKTDNVKEIIYLLAIDIINNVVWDLVKDNYADSHYVYYDENTMKFENSLYNSIFNNLDAYIREYYESNSIKDKFNSLLDSDEYKAWLNRI